MWCVSRFRLRYLELGVAVGVVLVGWSGAMAWADERWVDQTRGLREGAVQVVAVSDRAPGETWIGAEGMVLRWVREGSGGRWEPLLSVRGADALVHDVIVGAVGAAHGYAATDEGVYVTDDGGAHWRRTFRGSGRGDRAAYHLVVDPSNAQRVWLAAAAGLFRSDDAGETWSMVTGDVPEGAVRWIAVSSIEPERVYVVVDQGLFASMDGGEHWQRRWEVSQSEADEVEENGEASANGNALVQSARALTSIVIAVEVLDDDERRELLYVTGWDGVMVSDDRGATWRHCSTVGLDGVTVRHGVWWDGALCVATDQGVFRYRERDGCWEAVGIGLGAVAAHRLMGDVAGGELWAATESGVFHLVREREHAGHLQPPTEGAHAAALSSKEPTIGEAQEMAIRYAEVHPDKIQDWRRAAAARAALPTVSVSYDQNRSVADRTDEGTYPAYQVTDEKDRDDNWTFSVSWDLGDLVWSGDQTSIDVRSRLMVQLRDDILDEVNRLYFERKRLLASAAGRVSDESSARVEQEIHLEELTAGLDALTGGWFSSVLHETDATWRVSR